MKRYVKASLVDEFMKYHEDKDNWATNVSGFNRMYAILDKYGEDYEDVDVVFKRAPEKDQLRMIEAIRPELKVGQKGYAQKLYYDALAGEHGTEYGRGIVDAIEALFKEGWILESAFRTDL